MTKYLDHALVALALLAFALAGGVAAFNSIERPIPAHADCGSSINCRPPH